MIITDYIALLERHRALEHERFAGAIVDQYREGVVVAGVRGAGRGEAEQGDG
jgi:hypothetical protein